MCGEGGGGGRPVKYHNDICKGIQIMEQTQNSIETIKGEYLREYKSQSFRSCMQHIIMPCST